MKLYILVSIITNKSDKQYRQFLFLYIKNLTRTNLQTNILCFLKLKEINLHLINLTTIF